MTDPGPAAIIKNQGEILSSGDQELRRHLISILEAGIRAGDPGAGTLMGNAIVLNGVSSVLPAFLRGTQVDPLDIRNVQPVLAGKFLPSPGQQDRLPK